MRNFQPIKLAVDGPEHDGKQKYCISFAEDGEELDYIFTVTTHPEGLVGVRWENDFGNATDSNHPRVDKLAEAVLKFHESRNWTP